MSSSSASAALTGALLANKGAAAPSGSVSSFLEDFPTSVPVERNMKVPIGGPHCRAPEYIGMASPQAPFVSSSPKSKAARAKLSVRLDKGRHLRLKLAAAHLGRSSQTIMLEALDAYLTKAAPAIGGHCACLNDDG